MKKYIIIGIHTNAGKTISSAVICQATGADYWKPVQSGIEEGSDSDFLRSVLSNSNCTIHSEIYKLKQPLSPHEAARIDGVEVELKKLGIPETENNLIIETAGGLMSPLNDTMTMLDLVLHLKLPVILVSRNYLGSINHTLMTAEILAANKVQVTGLIISGKENKASEEYIFNKTKIPFICRIKEIDQLNKETIADAAEMIKEKLAPLFK